MLASIPINNTSNTMIASRRYYNNYQLPTEWPLNEIEENMMTLATCSQINSQKKAAAVAQLTNALNTMKQQQLQNNRSSVVRCTTCQRKFHSQGNLANHQQLYQH